MKSNWKLLSLLLAFVLTVTVLVCLPVTVQAAQGAATQPTVEDLEAVLVGTQAPAAGVNYDVNGDNIIDKLDLAALKGESVDKLPDSDTDDLLKDTSLAEGSGGALQSSVARGESTIALELDADAPGYQAKVLFKSAKDWRNLAELEMDTLWVQGNKDFTFAIISGNGFSNR